MYTATDPVKAARIRWSEPPAEEEDFGAGDDAFLRAYGFCKPPARKLCTLANLVAHFEWQGRQGKTEDLRHRARILHEALSGKVSGYEFTGTLAYTLEESAVIASMHYDAWKNAQDQAARDAWEARNPVPAGKRRHRSVKRQMRALEIA